LGALTDLPVLCVEMPIYQSDNQVERAKKHIDYLKSNYKNVSSIETQLTPIFDAFLKEVPKINNEEDRFLALANTRARLRMTTLYYFAGINNYLVLGTGNKVEDFGVGFFTKYGDGGVDLSPIADLYKTEVYQLANHLNINEDIKKAPPTDGLWGDERTDEEQIGASYSELEWAMEFDNNNIDLSLSKRQKKVLEIFRKLNKANQHKMQAIPVCKISKSLKTFN